MRVCDDLKAESDVLRAFLETLSAEDWSRPTPFRGWTPWDVVAHLHVFDEVALLAATDREAFAERGAVLIEPILTGGSRRELARRLLGDPSASDLLQRWHATCHRMCDRIRSVPDDERLPWFGPDMKAPTFVAARFMETWAHGQDVYDLLRAPRAHTDRVWHVALLGVKTFGWTFVNRGLTPPAEPPHVRLESPSGEIWEWNDPATASHVRGDAVEFCHVVTQGRHVADTRLEVAGESATRWMESAQCFAGPPTDPPQPGERPGPGA